MGSTVLGGTTIAHRMRAIARLHDTWAAPCHGPREELTTRGHVLCAIACLARCVIAVPATRFKALTRRPRPTLVQMPNAHHRARALQ